MSADERLEVEAQTTLDAVVRAGHWVTVDPHRVVADDGSTDAYWRISIRHADDPWSPESGIAVDLPWHAAAEAAACTRWRAYLRALRRDAR